MLPQELWLKIALIIYILWLSLDDPVAKKYNRFYISDATSSHNNIIKVDPPSGADIVLQFKNITRQLWIADLDLQAIKY